MGMLCFSYNRLQASLLPRGETVAPVEFTVALDPKVVGIGRVGRSTTRGGRRLGTASIEARTGVGEPNLFPD